MWGAENLTCSVCSKYTDQLHRCSSCKCGWSWLHTSVVQSFHTRFIPSLSSSSFVLLDEMSLSGYGVADWGTSVGDRWPSSSLDYFCVTTLESGVCLSLIETLPWICIIPPLSARSAAHAVGHLRLELGIRPQLTRSATYFGHVCLLSPNSAVHLSSISFRIRFFFLAPPLRGCSTHRCTQTWRRPARDMAGWSSRCRRVQIYDYLTSAVKLEDSTFFTYVASTEHALCNVIRIFDLVIDVFNSTIFSVQ